MTIRFSGCLRPIALVLLCVVPAVAETTFARALVLNEEEWESTGVPAIVDVDNDGYPDLVLTEEFPFGSRIEVVTIAEARYVSRRQTLLDTETSDLFVNGGAVVGDYDGDGDLDLFVPIFGDSNLTADVDARLGAGNLLLRNDGGHFSDATLDAGLSDSAATVDAAWFDYDVDGHLDLLVRNRGGAVPEEYTLDVPGEVSDSTAHDILYRNVGGGRFVDVTEAVSLVSRGGLFVQGFNEGLAAQDLNGDMIPDLLLGTAGTRNLLLINDNGIFRDPASGDVANGGLNAGIAVGDINNDGTMDIIEAQPTATISGVTNSRVPFSTRVLINIGGQFLDFTSAAGLLEPLEGISEGSPILADFDGDGDLDLVTQAVEISGSPAAVVVPPSLALFDNQGDGTFTSLQAGPLNERWLDNFCVGDFNRDGWLDIVTGPYPGQSGFAEEQTGEWLLYLNEGTENHWLAIELVGQESHRGGVGAQARVITADGAQIRQVTSSAGWSNTESILHFGLGTNRTVDELQIDWPSGRREVFANVAGDRYVRVIEGLGEVLDLRPFDLDMSASAELLSQVRRTWRARLDPQPAAPGATISASADLSGLGGPSAVPFTAGEDGTLLAASTFVAQVDNGWYDVVVQVTQESLLGPSWSRLLRKIPVFPAHDHLIFDDDLSPRWSAVLLRGAAYEAQRSDVVHTGLRAISVEADNRFMLEFALDAPIDTLGYSGIRLSLRPDDLRPPAFGPLSFVLTVNPPQPGVSVLADSEALTIGFDPDLDAWQTIDIPLSTLVMQQATIEKLRLEGTAQGTFFLDDVRLVTRSVVTAVADSESDAVLPTTMLLESNYPNPFNAQTVLSFQLDRGANVSLQVFDLLGQPIRTLASGAHAPGRYRIGWDGRDAAGRPVASGVYLYQLRDDRQRLSRKLLLLR